MYSSTLKRQKKKVVGFKTKENYKIALDNVFEGRRRWTKN